jgi:S-adenosylhomocysteine hydrolase
MRHAAEARPVAPARVTGPVQGALQVRLQQLAGSPPTALDASERLRALVRPDAEAVTGQGPPPPSPEKLGRLIQATVGAAAAHLSAGEVARALQQPGWQAAIRDLGLAANPGGPAAPHFLLAAHLARWMEGSFAGATLNDVVASFKSAHPGLQQRFTYVDAPFLAALQRAYPFLPQWTTKPASSSPPGASTDWLAMPDQGTLYADRLAHALQQLSEVPLTMPLTAGVGDRLAEDRRFAGHNVVMVQHMLGQANPFLDAMCNAGLEVEKTEYVGVPYQQNPAVRLTLEKTFGVTVHVPPTGDIDAMYEHVGAAIDRAVERSKKNGEPILVIDDGGYGSKWIHTHHADKQHLFKVVEQTTRGLTEIKALKDPRFPIVDVAGSYGKRFESAQVGDAVVQAIRKVLDEVQQTPTRKNVLVVGAGKVGLGVADSFKGDGARVTIYDPYVSPQRVAQLEARGYRVLTNKAEALQEKFLVVGCSGHRSIDMDDFLKVNSPVFLASASSKRVEIDTVGLKELATDKDGTLRRILAAKVNEQETWHYWTNDGRIVTTLADGLPVNFQDVNSIAPELIDHTMSLMLLGAGQAVGSAARGLDPLDARAQFEVQARMENLSTTPTSARDIAVVTGDVTWFGSEAQWKEIAASPATPPEVIDALVRSFVAAEDVLLGRMSGLSGRYSPSLHPVLLSALEQPKALLDETVDLILGAGFLPHIAHLARNPELTPQQAQKVLGWTKAALEWAKAGADPKKAAPKPMPIGATVVEGRSYLMSASPGLESGGVLEVSPRVFGSRPRDIEAQLASILYTHPACPKQWVDEVLARPRRLLEPSAGHVQLLRSPQITTAQLDVLAPLLHQLTQLVPQEAFTSRELEMDPLLASRVTPLAQLGDVKDVNAKALYAFDVCDAVAQHPNVSASTRSLAEGAKLVLERAFAGTLVMRGFAGWRTDLAGFAVPDYV